MYTLSSNSSRINKRRWLPRVPRHEAETRGYFCPKGCNDEVKKYKGHNWATLLSPMLRSLWSCWQEVSEDQSNLDYQIHDGCHRKIAHLAVFQGGAWKSFSYKKPSRFGCELFPQYSLVLYTVYNISEHIYYCNDSFSLPLFLLNIREQTRFMTGILTFASRRVWAPKTCCVAVLHCTRNGSLAYEWVVGVTAVSDRKAERVDDLVSVVSPIADCRRQLTLDNWGWVNEEKESGKARLQIGNSC